MPNSAGNDEETEKGKGFVRGSEPLLFVILPEMPFWMVDVPFSVELVESVDECPLPSLDSRDLAKGDKQAKTVWERIG